MAICEIFGNCPFAQGNMEKRDDQDKLMEEYCKSNSLRCARFMVYTTAGADSVPDDLYPDEKTRAYAVIAENS